MFVVRIIADEDKVDFKAFNHLEDANTRFDDAFWQTHEGEFESVSIFEVPNEDDVYAAIEKVKNVASNEIRLVKIKECKQTGLRKLASDLNIKL